MKKQKFGPLSLFMLLTAFALIFSIWQLVKTKGACLDSFVFAQGGDRFMDFFNHISYSRNPADVYFASQHACFPPLIYFMYYFFASILPTDATVMYNIDATSSYALLLYVLYCCVMSVLFFYGALKFLNKRGIIDPLIVVFGIFMSNIFIFGILERGNSAMIVCVLLMYALYLKNREGGIQRELALIMIAAAAGIKIYPAVFGILYLREKRWKEAFRLIVYGVLFFLVPFIFFGGFAGLKQFIENQLFVQMLGVGISSIKSIFLSIARLFELPQIAYIGNGAALLYLILAIIAVFLEKEAWKRAFLLCSVMIIVPFWSGSYTVIYMSIPFFLFFADRRNSPVDYVYAAAFALIFIFWTFNPDIIKNAFKGKIVMSSILIYMPIYLTSFFITEESIRKAVIKRKITKADFQAEHNE